MSKIGEGLVVPGKRTNGDDNVVVFISLIFIIAGVMGWLFPSLSWHMKHGWAMDGNSGPSDNYIFFSRFGAVIVLGWGIYMLITGDLGKLSS
ncbi:DUF6199 family natural product biosynthesis protein [Paenibacillus sp. BK720]|nr:DUF6199 family natural product biosynthesis protein [Paenibacillus sp. BK720]TCN00598.1 hypothetical protein EV294_10146 [Paenibacillus sp. BK033]